MKSNRAAIQTVQGNFSLRANSPLCQPYCRYGTSAVFQLYMWARRYSPTADNPGARLYPKSPRSFGDPLQKNNPVLSELQSNKGFTLIEILISTGILLIAVSGFLAWTANIVNQRVGLSKRNFAYNIAVDVSDRLAKLNGTNVFLLPNSGNNKYLGLDGNGNLLTCLAGALTSNPLTFDATGMTQYTNPWNGTSNNLFLYDNNQGTFNASLTLNVAVNSYIDHPNSTDVTNLGSPNDINTIINPIRRSANGVTYYVVWSVAYMPCATAPTALVKIFITVYWIEPEQTNLTLAQVITGLKKGALTVKNVSITLDKSLTATQ